jgi:ABC-type uncharacterized transport system ATPase subunit
VPLNSWAYKSLVLCCAVQLAVRRLDLAVSKGECFGLLGPNGPGKSTSISMLVGLQEPSAGTAIIGRRFATAGLLGCVFITRAACAWWWALAWKVAHRNRYVVG